MRLLWMAGAVTLGLVAFVGAPARAAGPLLDGTVQMLDDSDQFVSCTITAEGETFTASGAVLGLDANLNPAAFSFDARQPTSTSRSATKVSVNQKQLVHLAFISGMGSPLIQLDANVPKCSMTSSFNANNNRGSLSVSCSGDDLSALMSPSGIANLANVMSGSKRAKFKLDSQGKHWLLSVKCQGPQEQM